MPAGSKLGVDLRQRLLNLGPAVVLLLIEILEEDDLALEGSPGDGMAPVHAVEILAELKAVDAIEPMLAALVETDWQDILHDRLFTALRSMGAPVLEPALRFYAGLDDSEDRRDVCDVLAGLGMRDERVFELLVENLPSMPEAYAMSLADYGDPRAVEHLHRAFDAFEIEDNDGFFGNQTLVELRAAIEVLGGSLTEPQATKYDVAMARRHPFREPDEGVRLPAQPYERALPKIGRNEPCRCGSGKKYTMCCLDAEARMERVS